MGRVWRAAACQTGCLGGGTVPGAAAPEISSARVFFGVVRIAGVKVAGASLFGPHGPAQQYTALRLHTLLSGFSVGWALGARS